MATGGEGQLTNNQIVRLARAISSRDMESIALGYLGIEEETIKNFKDARRDNIEAFNRDILQYWMHRNPEPNQAGALTSILQKAASECGYVDLRKVETILSDFPDTDAEMASDCKSSKPGEEELDLLAEELRPYTEDAMKMEPAPWVKEYLVDMDELYCDLSLEKLENKLSGVERQALKDYKELFDDYSKGQKDTESTESGTKKKIPFKCVQVGGARKPFKRRAKKVLVKGDPGIGKTSLLKRIASDWAKGIFTAFSVVFFVFLKLVKPGDAIENVIIDQMPVLEGMGLTPSKLNGILEALGNRCLLVLDGLDEHALGKNQDILKILKGQKLLYTNIILSSRPHSTQDIEKYFPTIVRVEGFTYLEAQKFAYKILRDRRKVSEVLEFNPLNLRGFSLHYSPTLLSILCLLVREEDINLVKERFDIGDLFMRMVRCLFEKFTKRAGIKFNFGGFIKAMKAVGKVALRILVADCPFIQRSQVIDEIGEEAFDYGLLIGQEDFRLIRNDATDIIITFAHRSLQEFIAALFFILAVNEGESVEGLLGSSQKSLFFTNPFFLHCCLWFLYSDQARLVLPDKELICENLRNYVLKRFKGELIFPDIAVFYPILDVREAVRNKDKMLLSFLEDTLSHNCGNNIIIMEPDDPIDWILTSMQPVLKFNKHILVQLRLISFLGSQRSLLLRVTCVESLQYLHIKSFEKTALNPVTKHLKYLSQQSRVQFDLKCDADLSHLLRHMDPNICQVLTLSFNGDKCRLTAQSLPFCPLLTKLCFAGCSIDESVVQAISEAGRSGNLQCLSSLGFVHCSGLKTQLPLLFNCPFPKLTHVNMMGTDIGNLDVNSFKEKRNLTPQLKSLTLTMNHTIDLALLFKHKNVTLQDLFLDSVNDKAMFDAGQLWRHVPNLSKLGFSKIPLYLTKLKLNKLTSLTWLSLQGCVQGSDALQILAANLSCRALSFLDITGSEHVSGELSVLLCQKFRTLTALILRRCKLNSEDFSSLAEANVEGRLPVLKHLDVSLNVTDIQSLFTYGSSWNHLSSIDFTDREMDTRSRVMFEINERISSGCLQSLQELTFCDRWDGQARITTSWQQLKTLRVHQLTFAGLNAIIFAIHEGLFPSLHTVCVASYIDQAVQSDRLPYEAPRLLTRLCVSCHEAIPSYDPFVPGRCLCQQFNT